MSAGRICVREVDVIKSTDSVRVAAGRMHSRMVGSLLVVGDARHPIGILTDRDIAVRVVAEGLDPDATSVSEVMTAGLKTVTESTPIEDALRLMRAGRFRRVPVVSGEGKLVGILTLDDILELLAEELSAIGELIREEQPAALARN